MEVKSLLGSRRLVGNSSVPSHVPVKQSDGWPDAVQGTNWPNQISKYPIFRTDKLISAQMK